MIRSDKNKEFGIGSVAGLAGSAGTEGKEGKRKGEGKERRDDKKERLTPQLSDARRGHGIRHVDRGDAP